MTDQPATWLTGTAMDPAAASVEPLPTLPGFPFLHAGSGAIVVGPTGGGRSSLIQAGLYDAATAGQRCAYLGCEVTQEEFNARAAALAQRRGDDVDDELCARLANVRYVNLASVIAQAWNDPPAWVEGVVADYDLLAIDPLSAVASALDLDFDKSNAEFIRFYDRLVQPLTTGGVAVVMVDNIGHSLDAKNRPKGASAKQDRPDLTFSCAPSANPVGLIAKAHKVRSIRASIQRGDEWLFLRDTQTIEPHGRAEVGGDRGTFRPTAIMQRVSEAVEHDEGLTRRAINTSIRGRAGYVGLALELLISEGYVEVHKDGRAHRHRSLRPYREDAETPTVSTVSAPCPNRVPDTPTATVSNRVPHPVGVGPGTGHGSDGADAEPPTPEPSTTTPSTPAAAVDATQETGADGDELPGGWTLDDAEALAAAHGEVLG
jgi:hypothetical protein